MLDTKTLMTMDPVKRQEAIIKERMRCFSDYQYLIETYFTVDAGGTRKPFLLYPHQEDALYAYLKYPNNITMKTRQMGFTTFTSAYVAAELVNKNNFKTLVISKEMKSSKQFLKTIKDILDNCRKLTRLSDDINAISWLVPDYKDGYNNKESFELENGSQAHAQGNTEDAGRGFPGLHLAIVDEVAFIDRKSPNRMHEIWAALGPALSTVKGKTIMISTPFGGSGWYYETYTNSKSMGFNIIDAHWTKHPIFNQGQYKWIKDPSKPDGGYLEFYNNTWPDTLFDKDTGTYLKVSKETYQFIKDGKMRSPWYDFESKKLGPRKTACELDCTFVGTGGEVLPADLLREMKLYSESKKYQVLEGIAGLMQNYREFKEPEVGNKYVLSCDVMTGDGSDYSSITVVNTFTKELCATFKAQLQPDAFADIIALIGKRFFNCVVVIENAGGGGTTLQRLKNLKYPNIYYSILNKKDESTGVKKKKLGLWVSEDVRKKGGDELEIALVNREIEIPCTLLYQEFTTWIWDKDNKRRHAPGKHDDLIMALQHAIYYITYVHKRVQRTRTNFDRMFDVQNNKISNDWQTALGMFAMNDNNINLVQKRNNGRDIVDNKRAFFEDDAQNDKLDIFRRLNGQKR